MPELDGMSLGTILTKLNPNIKIIFINSYRDYSAESFEIKSFDYLLKPYSEKRITEVLNNLTMIKDNSPTKEVEKINKVTVFLDEKMVVLSLDEIYYIEVSEKESLVYTQNEIYTSKLKISKWEEILPKNKVYRTPRADIVHLDNLNEVEPWFNGTFVLKIQDLKFKVPVSRNNIKEFKELLSIK